MSFSIWRVAVKKSSKHEKANFLRNLHQKVTTVVADTKFLQAGDLQKQTTTPKTEIGSSAIH